MGNSTNTITPGSATHSKGDIVGKKNPGAGRPPSGKPPARQLSIRIPADLDERFQRFLQDQEIEPTEAAVVLAGLDLILAKMGYPKKTEGKQ
jgi:hypothetical protein